MMGNNFAEEKFGKAKCIFNDTIFTNATVLDKTAIVCDSPPLDLTSGTMWYQISLTFDGTFVA